MDSLNWDQVREYMNEKTAEFRQYRIKLLESVTLERLLDRNFFLLRAKKVRSEPRLIEDLLDDFLFLPEERFLEDLLRDLAVSFMNKTCGRHGSPTADADLEFISDGINHIISAEPDIIELIGDMTTGDETFHNEISAIPLRKSMLQGLFWTYNLCPKLCPHL